MMDLRAFSSAMAQIAEEKGIDQGKILETIEMAISAAYKKDYGERGQIIRAKVDTVTGAIKLWQVKIVVDESMIKTEEEIEAARERAESAGEAPKDKVKRYGAEESEEELEEKVRFNPEKHMM